MNNPRPIIKNPAALIISAWLLPGLGHILAGHSKRGLVLSFTILGLFFSGLLIGGIDAVDRRNDTLWFALGQVHIGPLAFVVSEYHIHLDDHTPNPNTTQPEPPPYTPSLARVNEMGTLYCAVAGGLNILAILDLLGRLSTAAASSTANLRASTSPHGQIVTREDP